MNGRTIIYAGTGGISTNNDFLSAVAGIRFSSEAAGAYTVTGTALNLGSAGINNESAFVQTVAVDPDEVSHAIIGFNFNYTPAPFTAFAFTAALEREMGDPAVRLNASLSGEDFAIRNSYADRNTGLVGLTLAHQFAGQISLQLNAEFRFNKDTREDQRYNLSVSKRF